MSQKMKELQIKMKDALDSYMADKTSAKPYFTSMKEISSWLEQKEK